MTSALIPSNSVNRAAAAAAAAAAFHSSYAQTCGSMLEFTSTDFGYELSVAAAAANYAGRAGNLVACYNPEGGNENNFNLAWEPHQAMYPYHQPAALNCGEFGGLFGGGGAGAAAGAAARQNLMHHHPRFGHHGKGASAPGGGPGLHAPGSHKTKTRRRVASMAQRRAANIRERRRMFNLNEAFDILRKKVPTFAYEKRLSRIETLRLAITYIAFMTEVLQGKYPRDDALFADADRPDVPWPPQQPHGNPLGGPGIPGQCRGHGSP